MEHVAYNPQDIAAIWFTVFFLIVLISPALAGIFTSVWRAGR